MWLCVTQGLQIRNKRLYDAVKVKAIVCFCADMIIDVNKENDLSMLKKKGHKNNGHECK